MRALLAIGVLALNGCATTAVVVEDYNPVCEVTTITRNDHTHTFSVEKYACEEDELKEKGYVELSLDNRS